MGEVSTIGVDLAKNVFQVHGADASGTVLFRKKLRRHQVLTFLADQKPCTVVLEACGSSHYWAREIGQLGHTVRLIPPAYVKPFVKRQKNDAADAEAICEAAQRPTMRFVAPKSEQAQAAALVFRARDLLVRQRTQIINARRGHLAEFGHIVAKGPSHVSQLVRAVEYPDGTVKLMPNGQRWRERSRQVGSSYYTRAAPVVSRQVEGVLTRSSVLIRRQTMTAELEVVVDQAVG